MKDVCTYDMNQTSQTSQTSQIRVDLSYSHHSCEDEDETRFAKGRVRYLGTNLTVLSIYILLYLGPRFKNSPHFPKVVMVS